MWDYESVMGKAQTYFGRAETHPHAEDDEFALWTLMGLEFLLRAPLAKVHPSLLAAPEGDAILAACGILVEGEHKSAPTHTVIKRLMHVVSGFDKDRQNDATALVGLRNVEVHTGSAALASINNDAWLPGFTRVADVLCVHLGMTLEDLVGDEIATLGRSLVDAQDKKLAHEITTRIEQARQV
ncbi:MAG: hypothetical protein ACREXY_27325, partial [Gammaproteobacteria bacterium]